jgi:uncharacterized protein (DUF58 family)
MLSRHGWLLATTGAVMAGAGRVLALYELFVVGTASIGLVLACAVWVGITRLRVSVTRTVRPVRVHAHNPARVDLGIMNMGRRTPVLRMTDPVKGTRGADISVGPLERDEQAFASYALPTQRRGTVDVGPMKITVGDPFGLARVRVIGTGATTLTVYPRLDLIKPVPHTSGRDPRGGVHDAQSLGKIGEEFYALRQYSVGDDLRRVHWPSTARRGELMVRQDELPRQSRITVLLDTRATAHSGPSFELAVSAAASVIAACARRGDRVRLVTTHGGDSGYASGHAHVDSIFEHLALVATSNKGTFQAALSTLFGSQSTGALIVVMGRPRLKDAENVARVGSHSSSVTLVHFGLDALDEERATEPWYRETSKLALVGVGPDETFADTWERVIGPVSSPGPGSPISAATP